MATNMATNTSKISVSELDFDRIKQELITYLQSQDEFSDYNFEGSSLNVLMDILSYNTHMNAFMANMTGNEMFLDSASIRQSVVSKAKEIGYTPRSVRASKAIIDVNINNVAGSPQNITMPAGTLFDTPHKYTFATSNDYTLYPSTENSTTYEAKNVEIFDGNFIEYHYIVDNSDPDQRFIIPSNDIDTTTLRVFVQPDKTSTEKNEYYLNNDVNRLAPDSLVYFIHETPSGSYEVTFGDGVLGKKIINGNYITFSYIISVGKSDANYISSFSPLVSISGYGDIVVSTVEPAYGGTEKESLSDIKFLAPKMYQSQRRAVTIQDYETFLLHDYPWIESINSWGGEDNEPPIYGKVFFSIKPTHTKVISPRLKEEIINDLIKNYNVVTIVPEIIDPEYIYIVINTNVYYNQYKTTLSNSELVNMTMNNIITYFDNTTKKFKLDYNFSPMTAIIDNTDQSFTSSLSDITLEKRVFPIVNTSETITIDFGNALIAGSIDSTYINPSTSSTDDSPDNIVIRDTGEGILQLVKFSTGVIMDANIGSVNYETGVMTFTIFVYNLPLDTLDLRIYATPQSKNIKSSFNQIIDYDAGSANYKVNRKQGITVTANKENI